MAYAHLLRLAMLAGACLVVITLSFAFLEPSAAFIALPAWLAVFVPVGLALRRHLSRPQLRLSEPGWKARRLGGSVRPLDIEAIVRVEVERVKAQLPLESRDPVVMLSQVMGEHERLPTPDERAAFLSEVDEYGRRLRAYLGAMEDRRRRDPLVWAHDLSWRHSGPALHNVEVVVRFPRANFDFVSLFDSEMLRERGLERPERPIYEAKYNALGNFKRSYFVEREEGGNRIIDIDATVKMRTPPELDLAPNHGRALGRRSEVGFDDDLLTVRASSAKLQYGDTLDLLGPLPITPSTWGIHEVSWEIIADELDRPICGLLLVHAMAPAEEGEPVSDLGTVPPSEAARARLQALGVLQESA
jgi:hypothetical protein